eukprot:CAMPEP_0206049184 /NCGR_PEP_ID=MMETSP1466-20131121/26154_1 /ASSEMBLY_ACC=CAM_ASM_001126 /TAXON_ID=44452 /ORGANISM="Pavlova gyrans, Strain CCMP608" /LENGTH=119 /DNA_ID=CAMNT_0053424267 /DNA_START=9 /DNA_END=368 /DNA_ORIENTATION=+
MNKKSPIAHKIVHEASEKCQSECGIARMWATCFWSAQVFLAAILLMTWLRRRSRPAHTVADLIGIVACAKLCIGCLLIFNYTQKVVREPVAIGGVYEITCALALLKDAMSGGKTGSKRA